MYSIRSSHQRCSVKKGALKNFAKFTGKHLYQSLFLKKVAGSRPATCEFCEIFKDTFFTEHLWVNASTIFTIFRVGSTLPNVLMKIRSSASHWYRTFEFRIKITYKLWLRFVYRSLKLYHMQFTTKYFPNWLRGHLC